MLDRSLQDRAADARGGEEVDEDRYNGSGLTLRGVRGEASRAILCVWCMYEDESSVLDILEILDILEVDKWCLG